MATAVPFYLVDVFAEVPLAGNPLALVTDAEGLDEPLLKRIAREFNQSETTFLLPPTDRAATWRLRSFTAAGVEVLGAGHNALGAWWWLADEGGLPGGRYAQQIGDQVLSVDVVTDRPARPRSSLWIRLRRRSARSPPISQLLPKRSASDRATCGPTSRPGPSTPAQRTCWSPPWDGMRSIAHIPTPWRCARSFAESRRRAATCTRSTR
jgi:Phenazine biosynthesis-like protein